MRVDETLGGSTPLRDIPERVGYDRAYIDIETSGKELFRFERSVEGGDFRCFDNWVKEGEPSKESTALRAKHAHGRKDTLSGWLLSNIGMFEQRIRLNQQGKIRSLSFRDLARLILVQENEIIKQGSPFLTGQYVTKTSEYSALKLLLTGVDDSGLVPSEEFVDVQDNKMAKVELIDRLLSDLQAEIREVGASRQEIEAQLDQLEKLVETQRNDLQKMQQSLDNSMAQRREILKERDEINERTDEINDLLARFKLLMQHYAVDLERLSAIEESGSLFVHQKKVPCPLCGAAPDDQHLDEKCDGNVSAVIKAAGVEIGKIQRLSAELQQTIVDLRTESKELVDRLSAVEERYRIIDKEIRESISPGMGGVRATFSDLVEKRGEVKRIIDLLVRMDHLERLKSELSEEISPRERSGPSHTDLSKAVLNELSQQVEEILKAWNLPGTNRVYFDETAIDFVIDGKPRGSRGKGLRAITYAAVLIALMEYCIGHGLPHPGFVVLDSPLLAYWEPEGKEDDLQGTDVNDRFYAYLMSKHSDSQVIIIENEHPPEAYTEGISLTVFTKNPHQGRYGFFPVEYEVNP